MGELVIQHEAHLAASPEELFSAFADGDARLGWLFGAQSEAVRVGGLVRLVVPLGDLSGLDGTARIVNVVPCRKISMVHEAPWTGRVECRFAVGATGGSRVRVLVHLEESEIRRLGVELGLMRPPATSSHEVRLGLLTSMSGPCGLFGRSTVNCAELAVEEINVEGGVGGLPVRLDPADDGTNPAIGAIAMRRLLASPGLSAIVGMHTSEILEVTGPLAFAAHVPYIFTPVSEERPYHPLFVPLGETPADQLAFALPRMAAETGGDRWVIAGNRYSWPRAIGATARNVIESIGGRVVGERYLPVGSTSFDALVSEIEESGADHVVAAFIGQDHVRFEREFVRRGLRSRMRTFAPLLDDVVVEHLGADAQGLWNTLGYFEGLDTSSNHEFLGRYRAKFGSCAPPVSAAAATVYEAVHRWGWAANRAGLDDLDGLVARLRQPVVPGHSVRSVVGASNEMLLGEATSSGMRILDSVPGAKRAS